MQNHVLGALYNFLDLVGDVFSVGIVITLILTWGKQVLNMTVATKALHYLFGCSWYLLWACLPKFTLATKNIQENDTVKERAAERTVKKEKKKELKIVKEEKKKERLQLKMKKIEEAKMEKEEQKEKKKMEKLYDKFTIYFVFKA